MPSMKPEDKWKLTAHEGSRTRRVATCTFRSRSDEQYNEMDIACITNTGQLSVYTIKGLRRQMNIDAINRSDIKYVFHCICICTYYYVYEIANCVSLYSCCYVFGITD